MTFCDLNRSTATILCHLSAQHLSDHVWTLPPVRAPGAGKTVANWSKLGVARPEQVWGQKLRDKTGLRAASGPRGEAVEETQLWVHGGRPTDNGQASGREAEAVREGLLWWGCGQRSRFCGGLHTQVGTALSNLVQPRSWPCGEQWVGLGTY